MKRVLPMIWIACVSANLNYRAMTSEGKVDFIFDSPRLEHFPRQDVSRIETPALQVFQDSELWLIDALHGEFAHRNNRLQLRDQVLVQKDGPEQLELHAEVLDFEPDRDLVSSDRRVLMLKRNARIEGDSAVFDLAGNIYRLTNARAVYHDEDS